jgi:hypothetical protein
MLYSNNNNNKIEHIMFGNSFYVMPFSDLQCCDISVVKTDQYFSAANYFKLQLPKDRI